MSKRKKGGNLLPFAAGLALGYFLFKEKQTITKPGQVLVDTTRPLPKSGTIQIRGNQRRQVNHPQFQHLYV